MRNVLILLVLASFLAFAACTEKLQSSTTTPYQGKHQLGRVACREYRYSDPGLCQSEAFAFYHGSYPGTTPEALTLVTTTPLVYSMKAKGEDVEIRFAVVSANDLSKYG